MNRQLPFDVDGVARGAFGTSGGGERNCKEKAIKVINERRKLRSSRETFTSQK
jgi:hypothetical protein